MLVTKPDLNFSIKKTYYEEQCIFLQYLCKITHYIEVILKKDRHNSDSKQGHINKAMNFSNLQKA